MVAQHSIIDHKPEVCIPNHRLEQTDETNAIFLFYGYGNPRKNPSCFIFTETEDRSISTKIAEEEEVFKEDLKKHI